MWLKVNSSFLRCFSCAELCESFLSTFVEQLYIQYVNFQYDKFIQSICVNFYAFISWYCCLLFYFSTIHGSGNTLYKQNRMFLLAHYCISYYNNQVVKLTILKFFSFDQQYLSMNFQMAIPIQHIKFMEKIINMH